jgi:hypothetical protein
MLRSAFCEVISVEMNIDMSLIDVYKFNWKLMWMEHDLNTSPRWRDSPLLAKASRWNLSLSKHFG